MDMPVSPATTAPQPTAGVAPQVAPAIDATPKTISVNDGTAIVQPNIAAPTRPRVEGEEFVDRGEAAELEIVHALVGSFKQGDRILVSDLGENVDLDRLVRLGAVTVLKEAAPAPTKGKGK